MGVKVLLGIAAVGVGAIAFTKTASVGAATHFHYDTATLEERQEFLRDQAVVIRNASRWMLPNGRGPMALNFFLDQIETDADDRKITMKIRVDVPYGAEVGRLPRREILTRLCGNFVNTAMYAQNIQFDVEYRTDDGDALADIRVTKNRCDHIQADQA